MKKINLKIKLISDEENIDLEIIGFRNENKIIYQEENVKVTVVMFDHKVEMIRSCNEYEVHLVFDKNTKTTSTYQVFGGAKTFDLETFTNKLIVNNKKIIIDYNLEGNIFSYTLEMEDL